MRARQRGRHYQRRCCVATLTARIDYSGRRGSMTQRSSSPSPPPPSASLPSHFSEGGGAREARVGMEAEASKACKAKAKGTEARKWKEARGCKRGCSMMMEVSVGSEAKLEAEAKHRERSTGSEARGAKAQRGERNAGSGKRIKRKAKSAGKEAPGVKQGSEHVERGAGEARMRSAWDVRVPPDQSTASWEPGRPFPSPPPPPRWARSAGRATTRDRYLELPSVAASPFAQSDASSKVSRCRPPTPPRRRLALPK
ncbi:Protein of unknown function [Gryllus bimaculatus]|nr:Protein of unknown function [Gryllus bimaculatus]